MSQQEFDTYLALLTRLLRIAPPQREQVAEEFRAHMEDRLDELLARGIPRDQAIQTALEEFGDAAVLAADLASISWNRKRRWYMKVSAFSVAGLAAALLLAVALWPENRRIAAPSQAVAQQPAGKAKQRGREKAPPRRESLEDKLSMRIAADFIETPMSDVLQFLGDSAGIQFYINRRALSEESINLDSSITMSLQDVQVETILDLSLEQVSEQLAYLERDGVLIISSVTALEGATEVRVYNCRDLLALTGMEGMMDEMMMPGGMMPGMGMPAMRGMRGAGAMDTGGFAPSGDQAQPTTEQDDAPKSTDDSPPELRPSPSETPPRSSLPGGSSDDSAAPPPRARSSIEMSADRAVLAQRTRGRGGAAAGGGMADMGAMGMSGMMPGMMSGMGGMGGGMSSRPAPTTDHERRAARLMDLIVTAVDPGSWQDTGGFGTISEYEGLIVVSHNPRTHKKIDNVLTMLRQSAGIPQTPQMSGTRDMMGGTAFGAPMPAAGAFPRGAAADPFAADAQFGGDGTRITPGGASPMPVPSSP